MCVVDLADRRAISAAERVKSCPFLDKGIRTGETSTQSAPVSRARLLSAITRLIDLIYRTHTAEFLAEFGIIMDASD